MSKALPRQLYTKLTLSTKMLKLATTKTTYEHLGWHKLRIFWYNLYFISYGLVSGKKTLFLQVLYTFIKLDSM